MSQLAPDLNKQPLLDLDYASRLSNEPVIPELTDTLVRDAKIMLDRLLEAHSWQIQEAVSNDLTGWFEAMIARLSNTLITQRYTSYFLTMHPFWRPKNVAAGDAEETAARNILDEYIGWEISQGIFTPDGPYPELSRLVSIAASNWINAVRELLERIEHHADALAGLLKTDQISIRQLTSVTFGISDPHANGRTAAILSFGTLKTVYKPRSLDGELGWETIINVLRSNGLPYDFYIPQILKYSDYGFMEFIEHIPADSLQEVAFCYERYGAMLCIAHAFGTYDLHHENIIVRNGHPVIIDAETLFRCVLDLSSGGEDRLRLDKSISLEDLESMESVSDIGMLPYAMQSQLSEADDTPEEYVVGALYPFGFAPIKAVVPCGRGSNNLQLQEKKMKAATFPNLPVFAGQPKLPKDYIEQIELGFKKTHAFLLEKRANILENDRIFDQLLDLNLRLLARPTMQYGIVFIRSISAQLLKSTEDRKRKIQEDLQELGKMRLDDIGEIEKHEIENLLSGDIPRFEVISNGTVSNNTPLMFSPVDLASQRFRMMSPLDFTMQKVTIREKILDRSAELAASKNRVLESDAQLQHAFEIIDAIVQTTQDENQAPYWVYTTFAPGLGTTRAHADRESLYDGSTGTALAIAEAGRLAKNDRWMQIARNVFNPILKGETPASILRGGGIARGLGGLVYSMIRISEAVGDESLLRSAEDLILRYADLVMEREELDEVLHGRAGFLLALTALYARRPSGAIENLMQKSAQSLMDRSVHHKKGICWPVLDGHSLPNMSHGTSGIAMALARWYTISKDPKAQKVLFGALDYDNTFWNQKEKGWIDARVRDMPNERATTWTWCNGRSGALLSRVAIAQAVKLPFMDDYCNAAFQAGISDILHETSPGLCCGTAGTVDVFLKINEHYPNPDLQTYLDAAVKLITLQSPQGHYSNLTPALFTGTAGLAFSLLRVARPEQVKSMLWFG